MPRPVFVAELDLKKAASSSTAAKLRKRCRPRHCGPARFILIFARGFGVAKTEMIVVSADHDVFIDQTGKHADDIAILFLDMVKRDGKSSGGFGNFETFFGVRIFRVQTRFEGPSRFFPEAARSFSATSVEMEAARISEPAMVPSELSANEFAGVWGIGTGDDEESFRPVFAGDHGLVAEGRVTIEFLTTLRFDAFRDVAENEDDLVGDVETRSKSRRLPALCPGRRVRSRRKRRGLQIDHWS